MEIIYFFFIARRPLYFTESEETKISQLKNQKEQQRSKFRLSQSPLFQEWLHMDSLLAHKARDLVSLMFKEANKTKIF